MAATPSVGPPVVAGSYDFGTMSDANFQLERLRQQAQAVRGLETRLLREAGLQDHHEVLELGSGPGFVTALLAELVPRGRLYAVEPDAVLLAQVEAQVPQKPARGLQLINAYGNALPLADGTIDFSYARFLLQHVPDPQSVVTELRRVTRPGGRFCAVDSDDGLVVVYPEHQQLKKLMVDSQSIQASKAGDRFIGRKLPELMSRAGFTKIKSHIVALTSSELPFEVLFNVLFGFKASLLGEAFDFKSLSAELGEQVRSGRQLIAGGVFVVTGEAETSPGAS